MNRIVLIGNGFDLAHGLKTGYRDFMSDYWSSAAQNIAENMFVGYEDEFIRFERIRESVNHYSAYYAIDDPSKAFFLSLNRALNNIQSYADLKHLIADVNEEDNLFNLGFNNKLFEYLSETSALTSWIDIENEYYYMLKKASSNTIHDLNHEFEDIKNSLVEYLKSICDQEVSKNESLDNILNSLIRLDDIALSEQGVFLDNLRFIIGLSDNFNYTEEDYTNPDPFFGFKTEEEGMRFHIKSDLLDGHYKSYLSINKTLFLNFNYTNTAERLYGSNTPDLIHIHGELDYPNNPIIFGYGDEMDEHYKSLVNLNNNDYLQNIKSIRYLETENYRRLLEFIESGAYQIFVMGHSCGNSDRTLLNTLFEHKNCMSIKPFYYQREGGTDDYRNIV